MIRGLAPTLALLCVVCAATAFAQSAPFVTANDVTWNSLGKDENDSMPLGNGDLGANVWTEQNGDLVLLISKADAWDELNKPLKLGRIRIQLTPNPFAGAADFAQTLRLEDATIEVKSGANVVKVWADANHPVLHVEGSFAQPTAMRAAVEIWRTQDHPYDQPSPEKGGLFGLGSHSIPMDWEADTVFPAAKDRVMWAHYNKESVYPIILKQEHLEAELTKFPDPLLHRCFGAALSGAGLVSDGNQALKSSAPARTFLLDLTALTTTQTSSPEAWHAQISALLAKGYGTLARARTEHDRWWTELWNRSWLHVGGGPEASKVSQGYIMQRFMMAASSRGDFPTKYNGGLFTVGHDMTGAVESNARNHNPDFRQWGGSYWNQNNRLLYWPLVQTGDFDLLKPWFDMYMNDLPMAKDRTEAYFHHAGASFIETIDFWGLPNINDFGWDNATTQVQSRFMRYHIQGALEVLAEMLDQYDVTQDAAFARRDIVPFGDAILTYYGVHWPLDADGKIHMAPAQSLETYQLNAVNPTPDIAGLEYVIPRMLALPQTLTTAAQRTGWKKTLDDLPPIATGKTVNGRIPRAGQQSDPNGTTVILPAASYDRTSNSENPESYVAFPYKLYGVGKPNLELARDTFKARLFPQDTCWGQDGPQAAVLGLTDIAQKTATDEFSAYGNERFSWFWRTGHDWIPDLDNGGTGMITLQLMLMQTDGKRILLLPAWPKNWTADFKLHAPGHTTVEGHVENGAVSGLKVTPAARAKDVTVISADAK
ncbi:MAG TPA: DUF5703 domain-containing protein [Bryobacteraceae bacterium]|nr:DUF5703 domain-containing protein [Bryobacteraceae bacterium]